MFLWLTLPEHLDTACLLERSIENANVAFVPGAAFFPDRSVRNTLRLSFSLNPPAEIADGISRLAGVIRDFSRVTRRQQIDPRHRRSQPQRVDTPGKAPSLGDGIGTGWQRPLAGPERSRWPGRQRPSNLIEPLGFLTGLAPQMLRHVDQIANPPPGLRIPDVAEPDLR